MSRRLLASVAVAVLLSQPAFADMGAPGFSRVPHDYVIEVTSDFPGYRFWLVSPRGVEPLDLAPGRPFRINGEDRNGSHRNAQVVAAPVGVMEGLGEQGFRSAREARWAGKPNPLPPDVLESESIDFLGSVPFYDSRERVVDRCRLEFVPGKHVRLVHLEQNAGSGAVKRAWLAVGVLVPVAAVAGGWWIVRRLRRVAFGRYGS